MENFYDEVAKKFGGYAFGTNKPKYNSEYPDSDPEEVFKSKIIELASPSKVALDIGCGDGKFTFELAPHFAHITGLDNSQELIEVALRKQKETAVDKVNFIFGDAAKTTFVKEGFDLAFNRRGPSFYQEYYRLLKKGGYYLEIGIGEKDCMQIKKIFGRGQNFGGWDNSRLEKDTAEFKNLSLKIVFAKDYFYTEYYLNEKEMDTFLQGVPLFEDYDSEKDRNNFLTYCKKFQTPKGIELSRHRVVYVLQKV